MLILEKSIPKRYSVRMQEYVSKKYARHHERVGSTGVVRIRCTGRYYAYAISGNVNGQQQLVAWLCLWQKPRWKAWEVVQVYVLPEFRGKGYAKRLYSAAINNDNRIVASGKSQSKYSRGLWLSFIKNQTFDLFAIDYWSLKERSQVFWNSDTEELYCGLDIYFRGSAQYQDRDVRLIATRKNP